MKKNTFYGLVVIALLLAFSSVGQRRNTTLAQVEDDDYSSIFSFGISTSTNSGLLGGFGFRKEIAIRNQAAIKQNHYFALEFANIDDYREVTHIGITGSGYTYGKLNYLMAIRPQYGREIRLFKTSSDGGINVNGIFAVGPTIGLQKPYYVDVVYNNRFVLTEKFDPLRHNYGNIAGSGGFFKGFGDATIVPGANVKAALNFEIDAFNKSNISLEVGFLMDIFSKKIEIMALSDNRSVFTSGYLTIFFGGKK